MHDASVTAEIARLARQGGRAALEQALLASRADTLATFGAFERALPGLQVPQRAELNPPLWELGHVGWFQSWWLARNPERQQGMNADPDAARLPAERHDAEALYHSGRVAHDTRWGLPLPDADTTRAHLQAQLERTLALLAGTPENDADLYFFRLALLHEDMHHEAALYMAQGLGVAIEDPRWQAPHLPEPALPLAFTASSWRLGSPAGSGFVFDNECGAHEVPCPAFEIDAQVLRWADYLPFIEATRATPPRYLRRQAGRWQQWRHGRWAVLDLQQPACHLTQHEAQAWCRWAGRRLPTEAEWERAAMTAPGRFRWGDVWEWTASPFTPYPGFVAHPYRDYSAPWFDGRPVLRGASFMTQPRMHHARYRNYFPSGRSDIPAGFRSCAL
jgi:ergothioneine biosynthesis protein EgtB